MPVRTAAVVPVKSFDAAKQRLSARLGAGSRQLLAQAMFSDVLAALRRARSIEAVLVVTDDHEIQAMLHSDPVTVLDDERSAGQSAAVGIGVRHAVAHGFARALLVPGDTPLLDPSAVDALLESARSRGLALAIVPDRHGTGTNGLLISPPDAFEPSFGPASLERHLASAAAAGVDHEVVELESLMHDVDTPEDLDVVAAALEHRRGAAPRTRGALRQLGRLHLGPTVAPQDELAEAAERAPAESPTTDRGASWRPTREGSADHRPAWA